MMWIRALLAASRRHLRQVTADPSLIAQAILVPIVVLVLCALMFGGWGDEWPVGIVDHDQTEESAELVHALESASSNVSPYFRVLTTDREHADRLLEHGRLQLLVEVPPGFSEERRIETSLVNVNSDATKNLRLRIDKVLNAVDQEHAGMPVRLELRRQRPDDVPRGAFIAGGAAVLAVLLGASLIAANLYAIEVEARTTKEMLLTPLGPGLFPMSALLSGSLLATATSLPTVVLGWLAFGLEATPRALLHVAGFLLPVLVLAASVGVVLAHLLRRHRAIQPVLILLAITSFFVGGGFVGVAGLPPAARAVATLWPISRVFEWVNPPLHGFSDGFPLQQWAWVFMSTGLGLAVAWSTGRREVALYARRS